MNLDDRDLPLGDELCRSCPWWGKGWGPKEDYSANPCRLVASGRATSMRQAEDGCPEMPVRKVRTLEASIGMEMYLRRNAEANYAHALSEVLKLKADRDAWIAKDDEHCRLTEKMAADLKEAEAECERLGALVAKLEGECVDWMARCKTREDECDRLSKLFEVRKPDTNCESCNG